MAKITATVITQDQDQYTTKLTESSEAIHQMIGDAVLTTNNVSKIEVRNEEGVLLRTISVHTDNWVDWYEAFG